MNRAIVAATLTALGMGAAYAQSPDNPSGPYLGLGYGQWDINIDDVDQTDDALERIDDDDNAWRVFFGWRFNPYVRAEVNYVDFGDPSDQLEGSGSDGDYSLDLSGIQPAVYGSYPIGPVELFAKVGYYFIDVDLSIDFSDVSDTDFNSDTDEEAWSYGGGVGVTFLNHIHAKLEYEKIDSDLTDDLDAIWLTGAWRF